METEATCSVCLDLFDYPIMLPCGHNFCKRCIEGIAEVHEDYQSDQDSAEDESSSSLSLKCPQCRHFVDLGTKGVDSLPANKPLQNICVILREKNRNLARSVSWKEFCSKHKIEEQSYFCQSCNSTVCPLCATTDHSGFGHMVKDLEEYVTEEKEKMDVVMEDLQKIKCDITAKMSYLQEIVKDAKDCETECEKQADEEIKELINQLNLKKQAFTIHLSSVCREVYGPLQTMLSVYSNLNEEAISLENDYKMLNFGDPMRRIKNYQKFTLRLTSFVTFRMRSVPFLPPPTNKLPRLTLERLDEVSAAIRKVQIPKTTQTDFSDVISDDKAVPQPQMDLNNVEVASKTEEQSDSKPSLDISNSNDAKNTRTVPTFEDVFSGVHSFKSVPTFDECNSQWRNTAFKFAIATGLTTYEALAHQFKFSNVTSSSNKSGKAKVEGITLQRFTDKLARGTSFHESLPSSPNFAFAGKTDREMFVFSAHGEEHKQNKSSNNKNMPSTSSGDASASATGQNATCQGSLAINPNLSIFDKEQKSSSTPNLVFDAAAGSSEPKPTTSSSNDDKWQLPKPKFWSNDRPLNFPSRRCKSRSPRRNQKKLGSVNPWPSTLGATGGDPTVKTTADIFESSDSESPESDHIDDSISRKKKFTLKKSNDYSDETNTNGSSENGISMIQRKRSLPETQISEED